MNEQQRCGPSDERTKERCAAIIVEQMPNLNDSVESVARSVSTLII